MRVQVTPKRRDIPIIPNDYAVMKAWRKDVLYQRFHEPINLASTSQLNHMLSLQ